jgi:4-carboxymuconolactone decarboxylase
VSSPDPRFRPGSPRIAPLRLDELDADQRRLVASISPDFTTVPNAVLTLLRVPALYEAFLPLGSKLLYQSAFAARERELVILRTAIVMRSPYEWGQHVALAREIFGDDDLQRIVSGPTAPGWSTVDVALLTAVDELHDVGAISDATWTRLVEHLDEAQLIELPMLVGQYHTMAFVFHTLGVQPEDGSAPLPLT